MIMGGVSVNKKYKFRHILFDLFMTVITGGAWLIWVLIRYLRTH